MMLKNTKCLYLPGSFDPSSLEYDKAAIMRTFGALFVYMMDDEASQVNGFTYIIDAANFNLKQQFFWGIKDLTTIANMWQVKQHNLPCFRSFPFFIFIPRSY